MRCSDPPEKVLKMSSTPPWVLLYSDSRISGLTPGSGTKLMNRKTISAPTVNQIRFCRSVAFEKFARLRLLAMLSARDAMIGRQAFRSLLTGQGAAPRYRVTLPPDA